MTSDMLSGKYSDSNEPLKKGDSVILDNRSGLIEEVCMPGSQLAENHYCEETGGLLVRFDDGLLELLPFGHHHRIIKKSKATKS